MSDKKKPKNKYGISPDFYKPKKYQPEEFAKVFVEYLEDRSGKVWNKNEAIKSGDYAGTLVEIPHQLPLTIRSFCVFASITRQTFLNYEQKEEYVAYFEVTTHIRGIIEGDQIDGATVGAYNPNIIARLIGLAEKQEIKREDPITEIEVTIVEPKKKGE